MKRKEIAIIIILLIPMSFIFKDNFSKLNYQQKENSKDSQESNDLLHSGISEKIIINGDQGWINLKNSGKCTGEGTYSDPYIIKNLIIDGENSGSCIIILNSAKFFIIQNCTLYNGTGTGTRDAGIYLTKVDNGKIINNTILANYHGIFLYDSCKNNTLAGNKVENNVQNGIYLYRYCDTNYILNNSLTENSYGIYLHDSENNIISGNIIRVNTWSAIYINYYSSRNLISENKISDNYEGIWLYIYSDNNSVINNEIRDHVWGIIIHTGYNNIIRDNSVVDSMIDIHIYKNSSTNNVVYNNFFKSTTISTLDDGTDNHWDNGSIGNYWSDYLGEDADGDGIGDIPYNINGAANSKDYFPIWWNIPIIDIESPSNNEIIGYTAPEFTIHIIDGVPSTMWYTLNDINTKYTFISNGTINQEAWESCEDRPITIRFSANNTLGDIGYSEVIVIKDTNPPKINIISPKQYEKFGNLTFIYTISINEPNLDQTWYSINNLNYSFIGTTGIIDQAAWDSIGNGTVSIFFCANDTLGRLTIEELIVIKDINYIKMWNLTGTSIYIDDTDPNYNWVKIESENLWCKGSGTVLDPYIIENVIIDGYTHDSCITILNSDVHFIIQNCELFNGVKRGIWLDNTQNGIIKYNIIHDNQYQGIYLWEYCEWNQILNNEIFNHNGNGISFYMYCDNNIISENDINNNDDDGIGFFQYCTDNIITNNNISNCGRRGISLGILGSRTEITGNCIKNNERGIYIDGSYDCIIERNRVSFHTYEGMDLFIFNSLILSNIIHNNSDGIGAYTEERPTPYINIFMNNTILNNTNYGLSIGTPSGQDYLNLIYKNSFINNGQNGFTSGGSNYWDNGSIGNYWDDYSGNDLNDDGIGDTAYQISGIPSPKYDLYPIWDDGDDPAPPKISIILPTNNQLFGNLAPNFRISITGLYLNTTWYSLIGGSVNQTITEFNGQIDQNLWDEFGNGTVRIRFYANDSLGNIRFDEIMIYKDIISPKIIIYTPKDNDIFGISPPNYEIFINESNFDKSWYTFDNGQTNTTFIGNGTLAYNSWNDLANGTVFIKFYASDKAGNIGYSEIKIYKDIIAPEIEILSPNESDLFGSDAPEFKVFFNDPHINLTWYSLGGKNYTFASNGTINQEAWDLILNGSVRITFYINDSVGNVGYDQLLIRKDILAPIIEIESPKLNQTFSYIAPEFELLIIEGNLDTIWYTLDDGITNLTIKYLSGTINQRAWNNKTDGYIQIYFFANDTLGHIGYKNITIQKDTEAPFIFFEVSDLFIDPFVPEYYHLNLEIQCTIFDSSEILWVYLCENSTGIFINRSMIYIGTDNWVYNLDISSLNYGDSFSIIFIANDTVGNIGINDNMGFLFIIEIFDLQKPSTTISFDPHSDLFNVNKTTLFSLIADDNSGSGISIIMYQINDSEWFIYNQPFNLTDYNFGEWQISFYSVDNAANVEDIKIIIVNLIDTTPPRSPQNIPGYTPIVIIGIILISALILTKKSKIL